MQDAVYVDNLLDWGWKLGKSCHLFVWPDTDLEVLHAFAESLGLKRRWFQNSGTLPHYDLTVGKRKMAIKLGAVEMDRRETAVTIREWRARATS